MRKFNVYFMALAVVLSLCGTAVHAATVTWGAPTTISADTDISISGNSISAFNNGTTGVGNFSSGSIGVMSISTPSGDRHTAWATATM